jgi:RNA polymerase sigma factor FliA
VTGSTDSGRISAEATLKLWTRYRATGDRRLRDRLVLTLAPMVKYVAYRKVRALPAHCEVDDLISCGLEAMIRALDRFDPDKGATLEQFAWTRVNGAMLDELRHGDWAPRSLRRWERDINEARDHFSTLYRRSPTIAELSDAVHLTVAELDARLQEIAVADVGSLNAIILGEDGTVGERISGIASPDRESDPEFCALRSDAEARMHQTFDQLPVRDRQVAVLYYVNNLTLHEIGQVLGVSASRVSQIHSELRPRLRALLVAEDDLSGVAA